MQLSGREVRAVHATCSGDAHQKDKGHTLRETFCISLRKKVYTHTPSRVLLLSLFQPKQNQKEAPLKFSHIFIFLRLVSSPQNKNKTEKCKERKEKKCHGGHLFTPLFLMEQIAHESCTFACCSPRHFALQASVACSPGSWCGLSSKKITSSIRRGGSQVQPQPTPEPAGELCGEMPTPEELLLVIKPSVSFLEEGRKKPRFLVGQRKKGGVHRLPEGGATP